MTAPDTLHLVCGCSGTHKTGCVLGDAEDIAVHAAAASTGGPPLIAALQGVYDAGLLRAVDVETEVDVIEAFLDALYVSGALGRKS